jgi:23S rRNA (uracil1939-C5)-methyltransferase
LARNKYYGRILENISIETAGSEGMAIARFDGKVIFVKYAVPGDIADLKVIGRKKKFLIAVIDKLHTASKNRVEPFCEHFGTCGGCKWQQMEYSMQLEYKAKEVVDAFDRIGKLTYPAVDKIIPSEYTRHYRNKLEYTFSNKRWLFPHEMEDPPTQVNGLGFHVPGKFDKVLQVDKCYFQEDYSNSIRNGVYAFALEHKIPFYDIRQQVGFLRNLIIRNTTLNQWMVILVVKSDEEEWLKLLMDYLQTEFDEITSLNYVVNPKANDTIYDLDVELWNGTSDIIEQLGDLKYSIQPKSFFQTNSRQAKNLYDVVKNMANLKGTETVYDLYCGTGSISLYVAREAKKVVGIESVKQAIVDAKKNAEMNGIQNCDFAIGDMRFELNDAFTAKHGDADLIITDPPRAGMHKDVVQQLLKLKVARIIYVSCKPSTQARDLDLLSELYQIEEVQPVDMFPHTHHVENIVLLTLKSNTPSNG